MHEVVVPKVNNNDATYTLVEWLIQDGGQVTADAAVAVIETSKAAEDLVAPAEGVLHRAAKASAECRFGDVIGYIFATEQDRQSFLDARQAAASNGEPAEDDIVVTEPARELIHRFGIGHDQLLALGKKIIKRTDIETLVRAGARALTPAGAIHTLPRRQWAVADVVTRSHRSIPSAFSVIKVGAGAASDLRRQLAEQRQQAVGLPELLIKAVAGLREEHPLFFGAFQDGDHTVLVPDGAHVAVTIDAGCGLYVPVIQDAGHRSAAQIGDLLREFHRKAAQESFRAQDLAPGNIGISLNMYSGVLLTHPIVLPQQTCMLSLSGIERELMLTGSGTVTTRPFFHLGIAYDHRAINGRDAMLFARELKATFEQPERLSVLLS